MANGLNAATSTFNMLRSSIWLGWLLDNPLLTREIRRRMRTRALSWSLTAYLLALGGVSIFIMLLAVPEAIGHDSLREQVQAVGSIGRRLLTGMYIVESLIALLIAPMLTASLAVQEKEKDTFDFLRVTSLRARTFVSGCLLTTACFLLLAFSCSLPILGLTFIFGGVSLEEIALIHFVLFMLGLTICAWGVFTSTANVKARGLRISAVLVLFLFFVFFSSTLIRLVSGVAGLWLSDWRRLFAIFLAFCAMILMLSIASARRLYDPQRRLFNYMQYTVFFALLHAAMFVGLQWLRQSVEAGIVPVADLRTWMVAAHYTGVGALLAAFLIFSAGRPERGDEVWQLRVRFRIFQTLDERWLLYLLYLAIWIGFGVSGGQALGMGSEYTDFLMVALPLNLAALWLVAALCRLASVLRAERGPAAVLVMTVLVVAWVACPAVGGFMEATLGRNGVNDLLLACSPPVAISFADRDLMLVFSIALHLGGGLIVLLTTFGASAREKLAISYQWRMRRTLDESGSNVPVAEEA